MTKDNLIPKDLSKRRDHLELSSKGGQSRSPSKVLAARINGHLSNPKIDPNIARLLELVKDKKFDQILIELFTISLTKCNDDTRREKLIDQLLRLVPQNLIIDELKNENQFNFVLNIIEPTVDKVIENDSD